MTKQPISPRLLIPWRTFVYVVILIGILLFWILYTQVKRSEWGTILGYFNIYLLFLGGWSWIKYHEESISIRFILIVTGLLLVTTIWVPLPALSDDFARYRLDGWVLLHGFIPYDRSPLEWQAYGIPFQEYHLINHPTEPTVYSPLALVIFGLLMLPTQDLWIWRLVFSGVHLLNTWLLIRILQNQGVSTKYAVLVAWSPFIILETTIGLHYDVFIFTAWLLLLWGYQKKQGGWLIGSLAALILLKFHFLFFIPLFIYFLGWKRVILSLFISGAVYGICMLLSSQPWRESAEGIYQVVFLTGLQNFLTWTFFDGPGFRLGTLFIGKEIIFIGWLALLTIATILIWMKRLPKSLPLFVRCMCLAMVSLLWCSPNVHPWYLLWFLLFIPLDYAFLRIFLLVPLFHIFSYLPYITWDTQQQWIIPHWNWWLVYGPVLLLIILFFIRKVRKP